MSIAQAAQLVRAQGRGNDTQLMHVTPSEVKALQGIAQAHGGSLTVNPQTGLPEAGFLEQILPVVAGTAVGALTMNPMIGAAVAGGLGYGMSGSLEQGLLSGLGAFGGASFVGSLGAAGAGGLGAAGGAGAASTAGTAATTSIGAGTAGSALTSGTTGALGSYALPGAAGAATAPITMTAPTAGALGGSTVTGLGPTLQAAQAGQLATVAAPGASTLTGAQQFANLGMADKLSAIGKGFGSLASNPSAMLQGQGMNLAMMGAPILGAGMQQDTDIGTPPPQESYIRPMAYDPVTQRYTPLEPVRSSDWGTRSFQGYRESQGFQEGGEVQQRYQRPVRTVDPAVQEYNQMLMNQARQEYVQQQPMTSVPQLTPSLMTPPPPAPVTVAPTIDNSRQFLYDPATQRFTKNPNYVDPVVSKPDRWYQDTTGASGFEGNDGIGGDFGGMSDSDAGGMGDSSAAGNAGGGWAAGGGITAIPKFQAGGDMESDAFVIPADVVSALGNGSTEAGLEVLNEYLGLAMPIEGEGDGLSDDIPATIEGEQPARVANGEAYIPPEMVAKLGGDDPERGSAKLYAMLDKIREAAHGKKDQQREVKPEKVMPA